MISARCCVLHSVSEPMHDLDAADLLVIGWDERAILFKIHTTSEHVSFADKIWKKQFLGKLNRAAVIDCAPKTLYFAHDFFFSI